MSENKIKKMRKSYGLSQTQFAKQFNIPLRTVQNWELGERTAPTYVYELIEYKLKNESQTGGKATIMKKYELKKANIEVSYNERCEIKEGVTNGCEEPELVKSFDTLEEAKEELNRYQSSITKLSGGIYNVEEYYIEQNIYDEDGEWVEGGDIWAYSKMTVELIEEPGFKVIGSFDNMEDAEKAYNDYEGENEVRLSF